MSKISSFFLLLLLASPLFGQNGKASVQAHIDSLTQYKVEIIREQQLLLDSIDREVALLRAKLVDADIADHVAAINLALSQKPVKAKNFFSCDLVEAPQEVGKTVAHIKPGSNLTVLGIENQRFYKVKSNGKIGYINADNLVLTGTSIEKLDHDLGQILLKNGRINHTKFDSAPAPATFSEFVPGASNTTTSGSGTHKTTDPTIETGPRGGKYYYTASGKKRYVSQGKKKN